MSVTDFNAVHTDTAPRKGVFARIFDGLVHLAETNHRCRQVEALSALSDEELASRGLRRDEIVRHVFRDCMAI